VDSWLWALIIAVGASIGLWLLSFMVEALRPAPKEPTALSWAPGTPINYVEVSGTRLRYIKLGSGPAIVLLHTLRTQLDLFSKLLPKLSERFTVYALDYPGHGYSDIPKARYDAPFFTEAVEGFLEKLDLRDITLVGVSIGAVISLIVAGRHNPRIARVVSINPYDYAKGLGTARSSALGSMITYTALVPVIGETVMRFRNFIIMKAVLEGGVADPNSISPELMEEMYLVGNRSNHYRAFISLIRNGESWEAARKYYGRIAVPVLLVWGDKDWARPSERERTQSLLPGVATETIENGGHFLPLDRPADLLQLITSFADGQRSNLGGAVSGDSHAD
jgi:pimeloyl-ACP methyl ester carboxylesterase